MKPIPTSYLAKLDRLIVENMGRGLCPSEYAELLSITTGHLSRICRDEKGSSASVYIETMIMTEAARLLAFTQQSISQVAYQVGFNDPSYFSRRFRLIQGLTPSQYKKRFVSS
jgi:AraC family transcriptional activator of pobA